ncbi:hypothetical protein KGY79_10140 [Candidatus Bipolaricaulota bacterium]|nr:hypothetical protein [Candidatus Bipolaricaulota bacterium]
MSIAAFLIVLVGVGSFWWLLSRNSQRRAEEEPRGRSLNHSEGTGFWPRSLSKVRTFTSKPTGNTNVVRHKEKPYWKRRGWKKQGRNLTGYYRTRYGTFKGRIEAYRSNDPEVFIYNPPKQLNNHDHSNCFFSRGGGKFKVHFKQKVDKPSIAIQSVEKILRESFQQS